MRKFCHYDNELSGSINGGTLLDWFNPWPFAEKTLLHGVPLNRSVVEMICLQHRKISVLQEKGEDKKEKETYLDILVRIFVRRW